MPLPDPVSWFLIERGWKVAGSDGSELGTVEETLGDENADIFDGLAVATGVLAKPRYVPAELVGEIVEGAVHLTIDEARFERLGEHGGAPPSV
ncbi:MAG TPA: PRC-barrel domain-containing protein [Gaiellaceae bacterium]|nr:PRC-barrel domain-containing protein [Gaiellaceae bacterium]